MRLRVVLLSVLTTLLLTTHTPTTAEVELTSKGDTSDREAMVLPDPSGADQFTLAASWMVESNRADAKLGSAVASGDFNGDGYSDLVVGAPYYDFVGTDAGKVFVYYGGPLGPATTADWTAESDIGDAHFGISLATADFNNDTYDDLVIGAPEYDMGRLNEGVLFVWFGGEDGLGTEPGSPSNADWIAQSDVSVGYLGQDVANAGDVNNDGYDDLIACADGPGAPGALRDGVAFVWLGGPDGFMETTGTLVNAVWEHAGGPQDDAYLRQVAGAGDVNNDGYDDVLVGVRGWSNPETQEGQVRLFYGNASGVNTDPAWTMEANDEYDWTGKSVAGVGDVNNDGYDDVLIAAAGGFLYYGSDSGLGPNGTYENASWWNQNARQHFGGDINNDGIADIIASSYGVVDVHLGSNGGPVSPHFWRQLSPIIGDSFGLDAASAGDVNGDNFDDVIAGAPEHSNGETDEGAVYLYLGIIDVMTPAMIQSYTARWVDQHVEVEWTLFDVEGALEFSVTRRGPGGELKILTQPDIEGDGGVFILRDADARPGLTYTYQIGILEDGQLVTSFETRITTPSLKVELLANRPNPFNPVTTIRFNLATDIKVILAIYDAAGRHVRTLVERPMRAGIHSERWDGTDARGERAPSGVYFLRLQAGTQTLSRSMSLLK